MSPYSDNRVEDIMHIIIPSHLRAENQITLKSIPKSLLDKTTIVVRRNQRYDYKKNIKTCKVVSIPNEINFISGKRQWILENFKPHVCMLDDDMNFFKRNENGKLRNASENDMVDVFNLLEKWLNEGLIHVGVSSRFGNNRIAEDFFENCRMSNFYAFNSQKICELGVRFDRLPVMEDFDLTLQLLEKGYKNRVTYQYAWGQAKSGMKGGCSEYRDFLMQRKTAMKLALLHPGIVKPVFKESKTDWENIGTGRVDVKVSWKRAYKR